VSHPIPDRALEVCETAARAGGRVLLDWLGRFGVSNKGPRDLVTEADLASQREIRRIVLGAFPDHGFVGEETLPEHGAEQQGMPRETTDTPAPRWIVDPLDGTSNYVHGFPAWCVSVGLARGDEVLVGAIHDPLRDECFTAARGAGAMLNGRRISVAATTHLADALVAVSFPPHIDPESLAMKDFLAVVTHAHSVRRTGSTALNLAWMACGRLDAFWVRKIACWDVAAGLVILREAGGSLRGFAPQAAGDGAADDGVISLAAPAFVAAATAPLCRELTAVLAGRP
jgi:myo-inositol-1(or 4)-monophosphatase